MQSQLAGLGWRPDVNDELAELADDNPIPARVLAQHRGRWLVAERPPRRGALARPRANASARPPAGPPVTGDWVALDEGGAIAHVLERRGAIVRHDVGGGTRAQPLAANVDVALIVEAFPRPNLRRAERLLALATAGDVRPVLVLTKADLAQDVELEAPRAGARARAGRRPLGSRTARTTPWSLGQTRRRRAAATGLLPLGRELEPGDTAVLLGVSGAGKSTLANALLGQRASGHPGRAGGRQPRPPHHGRARAVRPPRRSVADRRARHPPRQRLGRHRHGLRRRRRARRGCRFADCRHESEPGCAVRDAVAPERLAAWRKLEREQAWVDDRRAASRERERRGRTTHGPSAPPAGCKGDGG